MKALLLVSVLALFAVLACGNPGDPGEEATPDLGPPLYAEGRQEIEKAEVIAYGSEGLLRRRGLISIWADGDFDERLLRSAHPEIRLLTIKERVSTNARAIVVAVPDAELDQVIARLMTLPGVRDARPYGVVQVQGFIPNDPRWPAQSDLGLHLFELPKAWWLVGNGSPTVRVAVVDSGINPIPELGGKIDPGYNTYGIEDSYDTTDNHGHGTIVASIIAAHKDNAYGIAGVANVHVVPLKACDLWVAGSLRCEELAVIDALEWVFDNRINIDVVNLSIGPMNSSPESESFLKLIDEWGIITVASAGNDGGSVTYPGSSQYVVGVSGTDTFGNKHPQSNSGPQVDMAAPWEAIGFNHSGALIQDAGTSWSAAMVSGVAALVKSYGVQELTMRSTFMGGSQVGFVHDVETFAKRAGHVWNSTVGWGVPHAPEVLWWTSCRRLDYNGDKEVDVVDEQAIAARFGTFLGDAFFLPRLDIEPLWGDGDTDIKDLQKVFGRDGFHCR